MKILTAGRTARLVEVRDLHEMLELYLALENAAIPGVVDLVPAARTVLVIFDANLTTAADLDDRIGGLSLAATSHEPMAPFLVPTVYDGADLHLVCDLMGMTRSEFIECHTGSQWYVAFGGFTPGFGYLVSDTHTVPVPRLTTPRAKVPAGSVAMAGEFTGIYPRSSPGGWQIIGRTTKALFNLDADPPSQLVPGRSVCFIDAETTPETPSEAPGATCGGGR